MDVRVSLEQLQKENSGLNICSITAGRVLKVYGELFAVFREHKYILGSCVGLSTKVPDGQLRHRLSNSDIDVKDVRELRKLFYQSHTMLLDPRSKFNNPVFPTLLLMCVLPSEKRCTVVFQFHHMGAIPSRPSPQNHMRASIYQFKSGKGRAETRSPKWLPLRSRKLYCPSNGS